MFFYFDLLRSSASFRTGGGGGRGAFFVSNNDDGIIGTRTPYMMCGILLTLLGIQFIFVGLLSELMVFFYHRFKREYSIEYES